MSLLFNKRGISEGLTFVLSTADHRHLGQINTIDDSSVSGDIYLNASDKITFDVCKEIEKNGEIIRCSNWDKIVSRKYVWCKEFDEYFVVDVQDYNDRGMEKKSVTATDAGTVELSDKRINGTEINTEEDIARDDYIVTKFYDEYNPKASLLNRVLDRAPHWSIGHVDESLKNMQRSFSLDGVSIYDFLTGDCAEEFNCIFLFDTVNRIINVYDLYTVCLDCGNRDENTEFIGNEHCCPKCGSTKLSYFGDDTTVFVDTSNLTDKIEFTTDTDSIKNCFRLKTGDELMDASVAAQNPNGSMYITYITDEMYGDMSQPLVNKLKSYQELYDSYTDEYETLMLDLYEAIDKVHYYNSSMMPVPEINPQISAEGEAEKLNNAYSADQLSPVAVSYMSDALGKASVENALENFAGLFIKTGYVKLTAVTTSLSDKMSTDRTKTWVGYFNISDYNVTEEDVKKGAVKEKNTVTMTITINDDYETFVRSKVLRQIQKADDKTGNIYDVIASYTGDQLDGFKKALTYYSLQRLKSFEAAMQTAIDTLIELGIASAKAGDQYYELYTDIYVPYYNKLQAVTFEMGVRQETVDEWVNRRDSLTARASEIQAILSFRDYLGEDLYKEFCNYSIDDEYSNPNYISDGLDNAECFEMARQFLEKANKELKKAATPQHTISADLYDLYLMPEFEPLYDSFVLGNFIRAKVNDAVHRLRIIRYTIKGGDKTRLGTEFSDFTRAPGAASDVGSILSQASSMGNTYQVTQTQAVKGDKAKTTIEEWVADGLSSANTLIRANNSEDVLIDNGGIWGRTRDDITGKYEPKQLRITHNQLAFTKDNWLTTSLALGEHQYKYYNSDIDKFVDDVDYGLTVKFLQAPYITGGEIISGHIYSSNYSKNGTTGTHINLEDGGFSFAGGKLVYNPITNKLTTSADITGSTITGSSFGNANGTFSISSNGDIIGGTFKNANNTFSIDSSGNIKGASIIGSTIQNSSTNPTFKIDSSGNIVGATIKNNTNTFSVDANGNIVGATIKANIAGNSFQIDNAGNMQSANITGSTMTVEDSANEKKLQVNGGKIDFYYKGTQCASINACAWTEISGASGAIFAATKDKSFVGLGYLINSAGYGTSFMVNNGLDPVFNGVARQQRLIGVGNMYLSGNLTIGSNENGEGSFAATQSWVNNQKFAKTSDIPSTSTFMPKSGGTFTGKVTFNDYISFPSSSSYSNKWLQYDGSNGLVGYSSGAGRLGTTGTNYLRGTTYTGTSDVVKSDERLKYNFSSLEKYEKLFFDLLPISYKLVTGTSKRTHNGFKAQDVLKALHKNGIDSQDFAAYVESEVSLCDDEYNLIRAYDSVGLKNGDIECGLRYEEFIALNTHMIQKAYKIINIQQKEIESLKQELEEIKTLLKGGEN